MKQTGANVFEPHVRKERMNAFLKEFGGPQKWATTRMSYGQSS